MKNSNKKRCKKTGNKVERNIAQKAVQELEKRKCERDPFYFATHYCYTLDSDDDSSPRKLFPEYEYLKGLFTALLEREDLHIEKSRQMLVSWTVMIFFLHQILFADNRQVLVVSSKQENVDDGGSNSTPQSLLGKARYCYLNLPKFLRESCGEKILSFKNLQISNSINSSSIKGESSSPNAGRGGNFHYALLDEAPSSRIPKPYSHPRAWPVKKGLSSAPHRTVRETFTGGSNTARLKPDLFFSGYTGLNIRQEICNGMKRDAKA
jgi:hypothetical protein